MRNGNSRMNPDMELDTKVLILPMRNGNVVNRLYVPSTDLVLILPMRNGNLNCTEPQARLIKFLSYL